jgi:hypothetical protein
LNRDDQYQASWRKFALMSGHKTAGAAPPGANAWRGWFSGGSLTAAMKRSIHLKAVLVWRLAYINVIVKQLEVGGEMESFAVSVTAN